MKRIKRNPSLTVEEDYRINVEPLIQSGQIAEALYTVDFDSPELFQKELYGWWIIDENFHSELERSMKEDDDEWNYGGES